MKKIYSLMFTLMLFLPLQATHYMGGEISWECLSNGNYRFIMKTYRECYTINGGNAAQFGNTEIMNTTVPGLPQITMTRISLIDISPHCNPDSIFQPKIFCPGLSVGHANMGALQENIYTSDASYPDGVALNGVPPSQGWEFSFAGCCRNPCTNIANSSSTGFRLRAKMYSYNGQNANPCYDNSPVFAEKPQTVLCTGFPVMTTPSAYDIDHDSLVYEWGQPLDMSASAIVQYTTGYSFNSPLPGVMHHPNNVNATINNITGEISLTSFTQGAFVTVVRLSSFRCGQLISEVFREFQIVLSQCGTNDPPEVDAPFPDPVSGIYNSYIDTVQAGEVVTFTIFGEDFGLMSDNITPQTINIKASGVQFGAGFTDSTAGCLIPPCATLNPPPPVSAQFSSAVNFSWQTTCDHLVINTDCQPSSVTYQFYFEFSDDFCPVPGVNSKVVTIVVQGEKPVEPPEIKCVVTLSDNSVLLTWMPPHDPDSIFDSYHIYYSTFPGGPYQVLDSIFDINVNSFHHTNAQGDIFAGHYYIKSRSGCYGKFYSQPSQIVRNILLEAQIPSQDIIQLSWNQVASPVVSTASLYYDVFRDAGTGVFSYFLSSLNTGVTDYILNPGQYRYVVHQTDSIGCVSISNIVDYVFQDISEYESIDRIYPNPFDREIHICFRSQFRSAIAEIIDMNGKVRLRESIDEFPCTTLNVELIPDGIFLLKLFQDEITIRKIVKISSF